jgi:hypothetical protein
MFKLTAGPILQADVAWAHLPALKNENPIRALTMLLLATGRSPAVTTTAAG